MDIDTSDPQVVFIGIEKSLKNGSTHAKLGLEEEEECHEIWEPRVGIHFVFGDEA